LNCRLSFISLS